jgi:hypothetical protein
MAIQIVLNLALYLLFVWFGFLISKRIAPPKDSKGWVLWVIVVILAGGICVSARAIDIQSFVVLHFNEMLQALGIGILVGFIIASTRKNNGTANQVGRNN